ncbi:hypothetical protein GCM10009760_14050 [Kitasatospora kazusensis]|uniref:Histidine kinase domain-containing protein n=1 Tax=Kitasatospora kazusensis TaxID=407974 RepID=A0ABP5KU74_9ACTN
MTTEAEAAAPPVNLAWAYRAGAAALLSGFAWAVLALTHLDRPEIAVTLSQDGPVMLLALGFVLAGLFILAHRSGFGLGRLLLSSGLLLCASRLLLIVLGVVHAGPSAAYVGMALRLVSASVFYFVTLGLPLWLPDGRLPGGWGRLLWLAVLLWCITQAVEQRLTVPAFYGVPNPLLHSGLAGLGRTLSGALESRIDTINPLVVLGGFAVAAVRRRRSPGARPEQVLLLSVYLFWTVLTYIGTVTGLAGWPLTIVVYVAALGWTGVLCYAFARDRSRLLDRETRRVLTAFVLTTALIVGYLTLALVVRGVLPAAGTADAQLLAAGALAIGVLFGPTARWAMHAVDRMYYGNRARPYQVVRALAERLSKAVNPADAPALLCDTAVHALDLPGARLMITTRTGLRELASVGTPGPGCAGFPLTYEGAVIGELQAPPRSGQPALDPQDQEVLAFLADQVAPAIALLRAYEDLQSSRRQIVLAREEERRRLRFDLHDGIGPALSGLRLQVDTARSGVAEGSPQQASLKAASEGIGRAITELRRITDGLAPAALGSEGLAGALRQLASGLDGRALRINLDLDPDPLPALPAAVEVAVYRISGEALNNVLRHSGATSVRLSLRVRAEEVTVEAHDDGAGFPAHETAAGLGLRSMAERAEELGGRFSAANDVRGAIVRAVFPLGVPVDGRDRPAAE